MRYSHFDLEVLELQTAERLAERQQWVEQERLAREFQKPGQFQLVRLAVVLIAASLIVALLVAGL